MSQKNEINNNNADLRGILAGVKALPDHVASARRLVWENPNPDSAMEPTTIALPDMREFDGVEIIYAMTSAATEYEAAEVSGERRGLLSTGFVPISEGNTTIMLEQSLLANTGALDWGAYDLAFRRSVTLSVRNASTASISYAMYPDAIGDPWLSSAVCVPIYIYGIKSGSVGSGSAKPTVFLAVDHPGRTVRVLAHYGNPERYATTEEVVDAFMSGGAYVVFDEFALETKKVIELSGDNANGLTADCATVWFGVVDSSREDVTAAMQKWLA